VGSNAWERAQEAIAHAHQRATERHEQVITPDTAVSPFDASSTTVLPHVLAARGAGADPELTQRIPQSNGHHRANGHRRPEAAANGSHGHGTGNGTGGAHRAEGRDGTGVADDPSTVRFRARGNPHPGTSPFPASPFPGTPDPPVPGRGGEDGEDGERPAPADHDETPTVEPRRSWWRRLFGR
jgi:hypothetical protein